MPNFDHINPKIIEITFSFPEFAPARKKSVHSITHSWATVSLRFMWPGWPHPSLTTPTPKLFNKPLCEFVSTCKKSGYFIDLFWKYGWLKNPATILAHISGKIFFPIWDLCRNKTDLLQVCLRLPFSRHQALNG